MQAEKAITLASASREKPRDACVISVQRRPSPRIGSRKSGENREHLVLHPLRARPPRISELIFARVRHCTFVALPAERSRPVAVIPDDALLVEQARGGDERAFSALYRRHSRYLAGVAYRLMGDGSELDDVVQETFVLASLRLSALREPEKIRSWLVSIAIRRVKRRLAARQRRRFLRREVREHGPRVSDPELRAEIDDLYDALDRIPPRLRIPWVLARIEGESLEDVAQMAGISLATVKRRLATAEEYLSRRLHAR